MLELRGIEAGYDGHTVPREVSLTVRPGTVATILGPNGAGKTTLLWVASGRLRPREGTVFLRDADVTKARPYARAQLGLCHIPEGRGIYPSLTVRENLALHARKGEEARALEQATEVFPVLGAKLRRPASSPAASSRCSRWSAPTSRTRSRSWSMRRRWGWQTTTKWYRTTGLSWPCAVSPAREQA